jgi:hypothetical protein
MSRCLIQYKEESKLSFRIPFCPFRCSVNGTQQFFLSFVSDIQPPFHSNFHWIQRPKPHWNLRLTCRTQISLSPVLTFSLQMSYIQGVYKRMVRFQKFIKRLHSATGRCSPPFPQECTRATQSCSTALDRTCFKWRQPHTHTIWDEFDYRVDVCRVTQGAHIEGLWLMH